MIFFVTKIFQNMLVLKILNEGFMSSTQKGLQNQNMNLTSSSATTQHFFRVSIFYENIPGPKIFKMAPREHLYPLLAMNYDSYPAGVF